MSEQKHLYIFVTSNVADVYVNVIRHCMEHYSMHKEIKLVSIYEDKDKKGDVEKYLKMVVGKIKDQLKNLSNGKYLKKSGLEDITIEDYQKVKYLNAVNNFDFTIKPILYNELEIELKKAIQEECVFDVSGFQKDYLVDVYTILHLLHNTAVHYFKIKALKERTYDDKELIHNLHLGIGYDFENISESPYTESTVVKSIKDVKGLKNQEENVSLLKEDYANSFANIWIKIIRFVLLVSIIIFLVMLYQKRGEWDKIEPLTFIFLGPAIGWILNLFIQIIGSNAKEALNFDNLQKWIKERKLKKIEEKLIQHGT